uniref:Ig-like domain-containing protein n=1 Tax=Gopherus evgoodei TaxID=1825980 RepID=A0A8C4VSR2_9SAUR
HTSSVLRRQLILFASLLYVKLTGACSIAVQGRWRVLTFVRECVDSGCCDSVELHCEAIGNPIPEVQWWFEGDESNETYTQLWDGARQDRVKINATYNLHSTSTIYIANLTINDSGTYECRASNDPDRNHLSKSPKVKWIRSQANIFVIERECFPEALALVQMRRCLECFTRPVPCTCVL